MSSVPVFASGDLARLFSQQTTLKYGADLAVFPKGDHVIVKMAGNTLQMPANTLLILDVFRTPMSFSEALRRLVPQFSTRADVVQMMDTLTTLVKLGGLVDAQTDHDFPPTLSLHRLLLRDEYRTQRYLDALRALVRPTDVVLDIGTGSGVLAAGAALAGAKHVYAVEASSMATVAQRVFEVNGLSDRVTIIEAWSTEIELPERADILVSEILSNGVFGQNVLQVTQDAAQRLLKPGARMIPNRVRLYGLLTEISPEWLGKQQFTPEQVARWQQVYGIDFSPLLDVQATNPFAEVAGSTAQAWTALSDPALLADLYLENIQALSLEATVSVTVQKGGTFNAIVLYFEADLAPGITITTYYGAPERPFAWANPVIMFSSEPVAAGDQFAVTLIHSVSDPLSYMVSLKKA